MRAAVEPNDRDDDELLHRARNGNEEAFLMLYRRHHSSVYRFALHMCGRREIAEEVVQEVFLALLAVRSTYVQERGSLQAFLIGTARNLVRQQLRGTRKPDLTTTQAPIEHPIDSLCRESQLNALRKAILALPEAYRAVTVLCELEELSYADAAQRLGCPVGTVRSRLHRARAILEARLRGRKQCPISTIR